MELNETIQLQPGQHAESNSVKVFLTREDAVNYILQQSGKGTSVFYIQTEEPGPNEANPSGYCLGWHDPRMIDFIH